ncbi:MAG: diguanylate cyclase [Candidatus Omnitrophica bacterium]|nr:diguanylate cyclase [Candidatus Omnitrophota bacterium]
MGKNKILIVEDNEQELMSLKTTLEKNNYEVISAQNGKSAFEILDKDAPDLVILDIVLPDIDGFEICRQIRKNDQFVNMPVLFYSQIRTIDEKLLGLEMGASDFLSKSADIRELLVRVKNLLIIKDKFKEMFSLSFHDGLTNIYNRRYFQHRLFDEYERSKRYKSNLSCVIIDVDHFKTINDTFGHLTGDQVLKKVAEVVTNNIRTVDEACRYGGDEFSILLPETKLNGAYMVAERIRKVISESEQIKNECSVNLTISCGVTTYDSNIKEMNDLIAQADTALYLAKQDGRNQTKTFGDKGKKVTD